MNNYEENLTPFSLRHHFILSPQAERALTRLAEVHGDTRRTGTSKGLVIQGPSGVGKSTLVKEYVRELESAKKKRDGASLCAHCGDPLLPYQKEPGNGHVDCNEGSLCGLP